MVVPVVGPVRSVCKVLGGSGYMLHDPFLGADDGSILQPVLSEIDFGDNTSFLNFADSPFNLGFGDGHNPRFGAFERLPQLFFGGRWRKKDGKCDRCRKWPRAHLMSPAIRFQGYDRTFEEWWGTPPARSTSWPSA